MFSGIIVDIAEITDVNKKSDDIIISFRPRDLDLNSINLGDSIACDGVCLTVIDNDFKSLSVQMSEETRKLTNSRYWKIGSELNIESSLKIGDKLHGHFVSGHVDCTTKIIKREKVGDSWLFRFDTPKNIKHLIAKKGSIAINGVSLTLNEVNDRFFEVNIIPYTFNHTNFKNLNIDSVVNIEVDMIARYVAHQLNDK